MINPSMYETRRIEEILYGKSYFKYCCYINFIPTLKKCYLLFQKIFKEDPVLKQLRLQDR